MKTSVLIYTSNGFRQFIAPMLEWWPVIIGLLFLYLPTFYDLFNGLWSTEEQLHGPIILALSIWQIYRLWPQVSKSNSGLLSIFSGILVMLISLSLYFIGRTQQLMLFELASLDFTIVAIILLKFGYSAIKIIWFPLLFMLFMLPLPGTVVLLLTMPMKIAVSYVTENVLFWSNYPIARNGVTLQIGQYQLLVADACAGLQTLISLESLGLFYLNIIHHTSFIRNIILALFIVPISFIANVIRVITLTLITFYFGDEAGRGYLHQFSGIVLFLSALLLILGVESVFQLVSSWRRSKSINCAINVP